LPAYFLPVNTIIFYIIGEFNSSLSPSARRYHGPGTSIILREAVHFGNGFLGSGLLIIIHSKKKNASLK